MSEYLGDNNNGHEYGDNNTPTLNDIAPLANNMNSELNDDDDTPGDGL